ncbi:MAG: peptidoglycan DD-metalloendopeptidase family protein [Lysobacteraceae bacterium]
MKAMRWLALSGLLAVLAGCGQSTVVTRKPVERPVTRTPTMAASVPSYTVQRGDTLYGIAFRHRLDFKDVAEWNGIRPPYLIYPGQVLRLRAASGSPTVTAVVPRPSAPVTDRRPAAGSGTVERIANAPAGKPPVSTPEQPVSQVPTPPPEATVPAVTATPVAPASHGAPVWRWPTSGDVVSRFVAGDPTRQGINIAGSAGQVVHAAANGVVVYSGAGLIGYGELVIVKHNDEFLSAYGHNRKRLVAEGEQVQAGQPIAEMGRSGAARDMLHFEIRRKGKPVDPLAHLPGR